MNLEAELDGAFVSSKRTYLGQELAPYTEGSRLLLVQLRTDEDSEVFFVWAFLFIHIELARDKKEMIRMAWNKDLFREKLLDWISNKTEQERDIAAVLVSSIVDEAIKARVDVVKTPGQDSGN